LLIKDDYTSSLVTPYQQLLLLLIMLNVVAINFITKTGTSLLIVGYQKDYQQRLVRSLLVTYEVVADNGLSATAIIAY